MNLEPDKKVVNYKEDDLLYKVVNRTKKEGKWNKKGTEEIVDELLEDQEGKKMAMKECEFYSIHTKGKILVPKKDIRYVKKGNRWSAIGKQTVKGVVKEVRKFIKAPVK